MAPCPHRNIEILDVEGVFSKKDAKKSFERHATSKIQNPNDLFAIKTMGFRGEAMSSIASISHVEMQTKLNTEELATKIFVEGLNWISNDVSDNMVCDAKIRSTQKPKSGRITFENENRVIFEFDDSQLHTSPGQACVFYRGDEVLGGGWIKSN